MKNLVIGNETEDTDVRTSILAQRQKSKNHGLIGNVSNLNIYESGFYHTSLADLSPGQIVKIANEFDSIILLDQPKSSYPHYKSFVTTLRLFIDLEEKGCNVSFRNNKSSQTFLKWKEYLNKNKAFCFYPFLTLVDDTEYTNICPKNRHVPIKKAADIIDWQTDKEYLQIRQDMLDGKLNHKICEECYNREAVGEESTRQFETLEWANRLDFNEPDDFFSIKNPIYYEIRPSNICNIMCRTCNDHHSHLIEQEYRRIQIPLVSNPTLKNTNFDNIKFESLEKIYVGGGEATIMPEFYNFLRNCIKNGHTNFDLYIGTNGMKISETLLSLLSNFRHVCFSFSFDGYQKTNDYIRWGSDFETIVSNSRLVRERGFTVALQTVFSMYSITRMHEVFQFYDKEFPHSGLLVQVALDQDNIFMPFNHPRPDLVVDSMKLCQETNIYYQNGRSIKSMIDLMINHYSNPDYRCDLDLLDKFYKFNDKLDNSRNSKLIDYLPELDQGRYLI